jgi:hypothetical protein
MEGRRGDEMEGRRGGGGGRNIKDRLGARRAGSESEPEPEEEDMGWGEKMKRPRMGMVADIVEKKTIAR